MARARLPKVRVHATRFDFGWRERLRAAWAVLLTGRIDARVAIDGNGRGFVRAEHCTLHFGGIVEPEAPRAALPAEA